MILDLNPTIVEATLRDFISELDYDLHKSLERDEETGEDTYHQQAALFLEIYFNKHIALWKGNK